MQQLNQRRQEVKREVPQRSGHGKLADKTLKSDMKRKMRFEVRGMSHRSHALPVQQLRACRFDRVTDLTEHDAIKYAKSVCK